MELIIDFIHLCKLREEMYQELLKQFSHRLRQDLPAYEAHKLMMPDERFYTDNANNYRESVVNIILFRIKEELCFILTKRNSKLRYHSGQISLPGGKTESYDNDLWDTCKRETYEETGIKLTDNNFIGQLSKLFIRVSKFKVYPFVSYINHSPELPPNTSEVSNFFKVEINNFFKPENISKKIITVNNEKITAPYYKLEQEIVWGATAMILSEFYQILYNQN